MKWNSIIHALFSPIFALIIFSIPKDIHFCFKSQLISYKVWALFYRCILGVSSDGLWPILSRNKKIINNLFRIMLRCNLNFNCFQIPPKPKLVNLSPVWCGSYGKHAALHELGHLIGLKEMHKRPDRQDKQEEKKRRGWKSELEHLIRYDSVTEREKKSTSSRWFSYSWRKKKDLTIISWYIQTGLMIDFPSYSNFKLKFKYSKKVRRIAWWLRDVDYYNLLPNNYTNSDHYERMFPFTVPPFNLSFLFRLFFLLTPVPKSVAHFRQELAHFPRW